jgi:hypothetical protein
VWQQVDPEIIYPFVVSQAKQVVVPEVNEQREHPTMMEEQESQPRDPFGN